MALITQFTPDIDSGMPGPRRPYELGRIEEQRLHFTAEQLGIPDALAPAEIVQPQIVDPYLERLKLRSPGRVTEIRAQEAEMAAYAQSRREEGEWSPEPGTPYRDLLGNAQRKPTWGDPVSKARFMGEGGILDDEGIHVWASSVPSAIALMPLADPERVEVVFGLERGKPVMATATETTREWMTACTDALEIRNRGAILADEFRGVIDKYATENPNTQMTMVSVAAGTLLPTLQAAINSGHDHNIRIVMLENNEQSIAMAQHLVGELGFKGTLEVRNIDVFDAAQMEEQLADLESTALTVDAVGIFEYVNEELRAKMGARHPEDYMLFDPVAFFNKINRFTKEDGTLVIGQMRKYRPVRDFMRGVLGWPFIKERSPAEVMQITVDGGAGRGDTRLIMTPRGLYTMAAVHKVKRYEYDWPGMNLKNAAAVHPLGATATGPTRPASYPDKLARPGGSTRPERVPIGARLRQAAATAGRVIANANLLLF